VTVPSDWAPAVDILMLYEGQYGIVHFISNPSSRGNLVDHTDLTGFSVRKYYYSNLRHYIGDLCEKTFGSATTTLQMKNSKPIGGSPTSK
jgi:hypothetical protein